MPDLPASGVFYVNDYSGMGGTHWRPPIASIEFAADKSCALKSATASCSCTLKSIGSGKFGGDYDLDGKKGAFEVEPKADGSLQVEFLKVGFTSYGNPRSDGVIVQAEKGAPPLHLGGPSLLDKKRFFPSVLGNRTFKANGVLFGEEPSIGRDCKWVVIDPNRHKLTIWEKPSPTGDFVAAGQSLGASVFTNGPMVHARSDGNKYWLGIKYLALGAYNSGGAMAQSAPQAVQTTNQGFSKAADDVFGGPPYGDVISISNHITARAPNNDATLGYFGRGTGTDFDSYKIGTGNPVGLAEASGGLYTPAILNYKVTPDSHGSNQWFYWGLAPLKVETPDEVRLKGQLEGYVIGAGRGTKEPAGLIIGLFYHGGGGDKVQHLADVGVRDAVKLDGSDSVMLGHESTVLWGNAMSHHKRVWMRWGIGFYPY